MKCDICKKEERWLEIIGTDFVCKKCINKKNLKIHALLVASGFASAAAPMVGSFGERIGSLGKVVASGYGKIENGRKATVFLVNKAPGLTNFGATVMSQAGLGQGIYLKTGLVLDALNGKKPTFGLIWGNTIQGAMFGAGSGAIFGIGASLPNSKLASKLVSKLALSEEALGTAKPLTKILRNHSALSSTTLPLAFSTIGGAVAFPAYRTIKKDGSFKDNFWSKEALSNYARGALIGVGITWGFVGPTGKLAGGILNKSGEGLGRLDRLALVGQKFRYGAGVALLAGTGVSLAKGDYGNILNPANLNFKKIVYDSAGYTVLGGMTASYLGNAKGSIIKGLKDYGVSGKPQETLIFGKFSLGQASGAKLLYNRALAGAVEWVTVSPAFTVGGAFWENAKIKGGYYDEQDNMSLDGVKLKDGAKLKNKINLLHPSTWVKKDGYSTLEASTKNGYVKNGKGKEIMLNFSELTFVDVLKSSVEGPRSGFWMKPLIEVAQVKSESPKLSNVGGVGEKGINLVNRVAGIARERYGWGADLEAKSWREALSATATKFRMSATEGALAGGAKWLKPLRWVDSNVITMPGIVTSIDYAVDRFDDYAMKQTGIKPIYKVEEIDNKGIASLKRLGYIPESTKEVAKWVPFFMVTSYAPGELDPYLARVNKAGERFTPDTFKSFEAQKALIRADGLETYLRNSATFTQDINKATNLEAWNYLKQNGINDIYSRRAIINDRASAADREVQKGLESLFLARDAALEGNLASVNSNLQEFYTHKIWLAEGKPEGKEDVHMALAKQTLEGKNTFRVSLEKAKCSSPSDEHFAIVHYLWLYLLLATNQLAPSPNPLVFHKSDGINLFQQMDNF